MTGVSPSGPGCQPSASAAVPASSRSGIPDAEWMDAVIGFEAAVRNLWRGIRKLNRCTSTRCTDLKSPHCYCYEEYAAHISWAFDEHERLEQRAAQGMSAGTAKTPKAVEGEARQPGSQSECAQNSPTEPTP